MPKDNLVREFGKYYSLAFLLPAAIVVGFLKIIFLFLGVAAGIIEVIRELSKDDAAG